MVHFLSSDIIRTPTRKLEVTLISTTSEFQCILLRWKTHTPCRISSPYAWQRGVLVASRSALLSGSVQSKCASTWSWVYAKKKKKRHFLLNQIVLTKGWKPSQQPMPAENQHCQTDGGAPHLNTLNLALVKPGSCVSAGGRSLRDGSGPLYHSLYHCPTLRSVISGWWVAMFSSQVEFFPGIHRDSCPLPVATRANIFPASGGQVILF